MLNNPPIFLGGQGGMVGPFRMGYGNVVAAGSVLRKDVDMENKLIMSRSHPGMVVDLIPRAYPGLSRVVENNVLYIANLIALQQWYIHVRKIFFENQIWEPDLGRALSCEWPKRRGFGGSRI
jgi:UDP-N-acetylglucosamine/UDP-N-acetylgalactosamine diphosphorylase